VCVSLSVQCLVFSSRRLFDLFFSSKRHMICFLLVSSVSTLDFLSGSVTHTHTIKRDFNDERSLSLSLSLSQVFDRTRRCCLTTDYSKWAAERHWHISRNCFFSLTAFSHSTCTTHTHSCLKSTQTQTMGALYNHLKFYTVQHLL